MDREKVIYSIERCICHVPDACRDCAYDAGHPYNECVEMLLRDVLALLKEQEIMMQCIKGKCHICPHCANCDADDNGLLKEQQGTGCWEWITEDKYRCSECQNTTYVDECMGKPQYLFCPYCGRKMTFAGRN